MYKKYDLLYFHIRLILVSANTLRCNISMVSEVKKLYQDTPSNCKQEIKLFSCDPLVSVCAFSICPDSQSFVSEFKSIYYFNYFYTIIEMFLVLESKFLGVGHHDK